MTTKEMEIADLAWCLMQQVKSSKDGDVFIFCDKDDKKVFELSVKHRGELK